MDIGGHVVGLELRDRGAHLVGGLDLDADVVHCSGDAATGDEHELEGWFGDGEVGVAVADLGRFGLEQLGVESDCFVEIVDVQSELDTGHGIPPID